MRYRRLKGYKYQLTGYFAVNLPMPFDQYTCRTDYLLLSQGRLVIGEDYAWDGPSGPTIDTRTFLRGSLIHDALYQLIRLGMLPKELRIEADKVLKRACLADGMNRFRAWYVYKSVRMFGGGAVKPRKESFYEEIVL